MTIQRYAAVDDVGKVINPMIVDGQIVGGIAQGVGQALWENAHYDENGQLLSGTMMDYALPRADQFPGIETGRIETPSPHNPLGVKGAGEMGMSSYLQDAEDSLIQARYYEGSGKEED